ncbi:hypothetical protein [Microbacter margulisiae]|uniref:Tetratricopeptide (TPR) repeat protein n=1 Tax=Microbacter margulisiae TaxID=1350067 RepID=A0A7W5H3D1_9PORP|nr:hypothetical protein [Microbacter margulisiae]MBB3188346.1 tetratricopeptide (TPR) repeat protein [Microbacter margulisiae]
MRRFLSFLLPVLLLTACGHTPPQDKVLLAKADSLMDAYPESALITLRHIRNLRQLSSSDHAWYALLMSQALDKCNIEVQSDSLIRIATHYYRVNDPVRAGYAWFYMARVDENRGNSEGQAAALLKAQTYATQSCNNKLLGFVYGDKAKMYQDQNQVDSMLHYNLLAYSNLKKAGDQRNSIVSLLVIGYSYYLAKQYQSALSYYNLALKECSTKEPFLISSIHRQQCLTYYCLKKYHQALHFARLSTSSSDIYNYSKMIDLAMVFNKLNQLDSAGFYLRKCENPHEMASEYYQTLINIGAKQKQWNAVIYYTDRLVTAKDSLYKHSLSESFAGVEKKYHYKNVISQNKSLIIKNQQSHIAILFLLLIISIGGIVFSLFRNKQNEKMLEQQRLLTSKEKELALHAEERVATLQKQINAQQNALKALSKLRRKMRESAKVRFPEDRMSTHLLDDTDQETIDQIIKDVVENVDLLYNNISKRLMDFFPDLLENEILICCFLLAGFDNVTIYTTLHLQPGSYNVKRTNLRKKLHLDHEAELTDFLAKF